MMKLVKHTWVRDKRHDALHEINPIKNNPIKGRVISTDNSEQVVIQLQSKQTQIVPIQYVGCGLQVGMTVRELPEYLGTPSLGIGTILRTRQLAESEQVLVSFPDTGMIRWLPFERLQQIKDAYQRFLIQHFGDEYNGERFRLRTLAYALEMWHENTGALSHLDIDPLPHQIHLVHHILSSGSLNWLIADDVGLGKTIETGMLLSALQQRGRLNRVLLVTPAGLTKQWQEELHHKFHLDKFQIYGEDFHIHENRHWKLYDYVITSIDRLKDEQHLEPLLQAGRWDLIIFDEAHRLSRRQYGMKFQASERFNLARQLRPLSDAMILLSATPHQGMSDKFQALLELLRPERKDEILQLALNPEIIKDMVFRNNKSEVTDLNGQFIFKGQSTHAIKIPTTPEFKQFDADLQDYFTNGYRISLNHDQNNSQARAIGFVMTTYRKLAASSIAAIHTALQRRLNRLEQHIQAHIQSVTQEDERFGGEYEEMQLWQETQSTHEFFVGETESLKNLLAQSKYLLEHDSKCQTLLETLIPQIHAKNQQEKLLIFTEYKTTQSYLQEKLATQYGVEKIGLIHGSMSHQERRRVIDEFEQGQIQFLISTEAGGEGINLQRYCHIMVNYDLPWNPMRLVQRIGRLYRYGQQKKVMIFNLHAPDTADSKIINLMYERINQVVNDMSRLSGEYNEGLYNDIFGQLAELTDVQDILTRVSGNITQTQNQIDDALNRARDALIYQRELFEHAAHFQTQQSPRLPISNEHWRSFVLGMFDLLNIAYTSIHNQHTWDIVLPENLAQLLRWRKTHYRVTTDRISAQLFKNVEILDGQHPLMQFLLQTAKSYEFQGHCAMIHASYNGVYACNIMRWQNQQGERRQQELVILHLNENDEININPVYFSDWLKQSQIQASIHQNVSSSIEERKNMIYKMEKYIDTLFHQNTKNLLPENQQWLCLAQTPSL